MRKLLIASVLGLALLVLPNMAWAQEGTIAGTVVDQASGDMLPGATVQVVDLNIGDATGPEGEYEITGVPVGEQTVRVTFVGYQAVERTVNVPDGGTVRANFKLEPEAEELQEVLVTGYRPEEARVETGAASSVSGEAVETADLSSAEGALQGRASGVRVTSDTGQPGSGFNVRVRGALSINAGEGPLYIVDGVQINKSNNLSLASGNPLASISPNDIESIRVLKDASAASIYGAQAANGVVLIETKSGDVGQTQINFSTRLGTVSNFTPYQVMNSEEFIDFRADAFDNAVRELYGIPGSDLLGQPVRGFVNSIWGPDSIQTDWTDAVFRTGLTQTYNASIQGGNEDTQFYVSGRFVRDEGQVIDSYFRQGGIRLNFNHQATDFLSVSSKTNLATNRYEGTIENGPYINSPFWSAFHLPPTSSVYNEPGNPESGYNLSPNSTFSYNPVAQEDFNTRESKVNSINTNVTADWSLPGGFAARTFAGVQYEDVEEYDYGDPRLPPNQAGDGAPIGSGTFLGERDITFNVSQTLSYDRLFSDVHRVSLLGGAEVKRNKENFSFASGEQFPNELFRTLSSAAVPTDVSTSSTQYRQLSFFGNGTYNYDNTYQAGVTVRRDANSRFGVENQAGLFWTVSGYWRLSNESFLQADFLTDLKLRASYGITGNSQIANFQSRQQFSGAGEYAGFPGIRPTALGNDSLTWEEKVSTNIGLDYGFFSGRIQGSVDFWRDDRQELLLFRDLPTDSGFGSYLDNVGEVRIEGIDISVSTVNIRDWNSLSWTSDFNISFERSEVLSLLPDDDEISSGGIWRVGEPAEQLQYVRYAGVNPSNGRPMYYDKNGDLTYVPNDVNDEELIGNTRPDFYGGLNNTLSFGGLQVSVFFQYDYGRTILNNDAFFQELGYFPFNKTDVLVDDRWKQPGDITKYPKAYGSLLGSALGLTDLSVYPDGTSEGNFTTRFVENASYIRLKTAKISYSLPQSLLQQVSQLRNLTLFVQGQNLLTWTNYTGPDPELVGTSGLGDYPQGRTITAGIDIGL